MKMKLEQGRVWECIDPRLADYNGHEVGSLIKLALRCTSQVSSMCSACLLADSLPCLSFKLVQRGQIHHCS